MIESKNISNQSGIYKFTNTINNKCYIGKTSNLQVRIQGHLKDYKNEKINSYFYSSIRKHGVENFYVEILVQGNFTNNELNDLEIDFIRLYNSNHSKFGYNLTEGGDGQSGYKHSKETIQKQINSRKGYRHSEETKEKLRQVKLGKKLSKEHIESLKVKKSEETKLRMSKSKTGVKRSEEAKEKLRKPKSKKVKRRKQSVETQLKKQKTKRFNKNMKLIQENNFIYDWLYI